MVGTGLAGLDSERAWEMRESLLRGETNAEALGRMAGIYGDVSMAGVRKARADAARREGS